MSIYYNLIWSAHWIRVSDNLANLDTYTIINVRLGVYGTANHIKDSDVVHSRREAAIW